ncbi:DUF3795 domain-containing protein [candidate division WOR-3 bacterium]|uniref:DUF3795 domain-containing protein n=1 Tax=candidate division WOR-3 bacterium TaxID=2052148 RepID=A0A9D5KB25_UNCW3|nr:DUF3795 domain-containing protein [candidate division WOR-3 bacterium]MBD3364864.1 DUF3795 domain-containing protein [candidate division WOR-3 bacterium]
MNNQGVLVIAYCGIKCIECDAYLATKNDDEAKKEEMAAEARERGMNITAADISCEGCKTNSGIQISYCGSCEIRACAIEKRYSTCAQCREMEGCEKLTFIHKHNAEAKENLEELRG